MKRFIAILAVPALISSTASTSLAQGPLELARSQRVAEYCLQIEQNGVIEKLTKRAEHREALAQLQEQSVEDFKKLLGKARFVAYTSSACAAVGVVAASFIPGVAAYTLPLGKVTTAGLLTSSVAVPASYYGVRYLYRTSDRRELGVNHLKLSLEDLLADAKTEAEFRDLLDDAARLPSHVASKFSEIRRHAGQDFERFLDTLRDPKTGEIRSRWYSFGHDDRRYVEGLAADALTQLEITRLEVSASRGLAERLKQDCRL
jgi:hypothetical protein